MNKINLHKILGLHIAISVKQAERVLKEMNLDDHNTIDFEGVSIVSEEFLKTILDAFITKPIDFNILGLHLMLINHNGLTKIAFKKMLEKRKEEIGEYNAK